MNIWSKIKKWLSPAREYPPVTNKVIKAHKITVPTARKVYPTLVANTITSVQPMTMPDSGLFFDYVFRHEYKWPFNLNVEQLEPGTLCENIHGERFIFLSREKNDPVDITFSLTSKGLDTVITEPEMICSFFDVSNETTIIRPVRKHEPLHFTSHPYYALRMKVCTPETD